MKITVFLLALVYLICVFFDIEDTVSFIFWLPEYRTDNFLWSWEGLQIVNCLTILEELFFQAVSLSNFQNQLFDIVYNLLYFVVNDKQQFIFIFINVSCERGLAVFFTAHKIV